MLFVKRCTLIRDADGLEFEAVQKRCKCQARNSPDTKPMKPPALTIACALGILGALGALLLLAAVNPAGAGPPPSAADQASDHPAFVVQREAAITASASSPARSHRLVIPGAFLISTSLAGIAALSMASRSRGPSRRRGEQFNIRLRGPPVLYVAF